MTDYEKLLVAASWRQEQLEQRLEGNVGIQEKMDLSAERGRLNAFCKFCLLAG